MALTVKVKDSQAEYRLSNYKFQSTFFVDSSVTAGLKAGFFAGLKGDGTSNGVTPVTTLVYAGADAKIKASGIIYQASAVDAYGRRDNLSEETNLFPFGVRTSEGIGLLKKAVLEVTDNSNSYNTYFRTTTYTLGTPTSQTNTTITYTGDKTSLVRIGDKIKNTATTYVTNVVYTAAPTNTTVITTVTGDTLGTDATETFVLTQIDEPVYLAVNMTGDLPFTTIPPASGDLKQIVGVIESGIAVRIDLTLDVNPSVV